MGYLEVYCLSNIYSFLDIFPLQIQKHQFLSGKSVFSLDSSKSTLKESIPTLDVGLSFLFKDPLSGFLSES